jgi:aspartyl protease family protein
MNADDAGYLVYLIALAALVGSGLLAGNRIGWPKTLRYMLVWAGIALVLLVLYSFRSVLQPTAARVTADLVPSRGAAVEGGRLYSAQSDGHFYIDGTVNGTQIAFLVDTGASAVVLSKRDAERAGVALAGLRYDLMVQTANGAARAAKVDVAALTIGPYALGRHAVQITDSDLDVSLLGMSALRTFGAIEISGDQLVLKERPGG